MPDQLQLRGGTTTEHNSFTGVAREVTVDTTKKTLVVHDGSQVGGTPLMKEAGANNAASVILGSGGVNAFTIDSNQDITFTGASANVVFDKSVNTLDFQDGAFAAFGNARDLRIYHNGSESYIQDQGTGKLNLITEGASVNISKGVSESMAVFKIDHAVELYYDNTKRLETTSYGASISGTFLASGNIKLATDTGGFFAGAGDDLEITFDGSNSFIKDSSSSGGLVIQTPLLAVKNAAGSENMIVATQNGAVQLMHDNVQSLQTIATGCEIIKSASNTNADLFIKSTAGGQARLQLEAGGNQGGGISRAARIDFVNTEVSSTPQWTLINDYNQTGTNDFSIRHGAERSIVLNRDSSTELYFDGSIKLNTNAVGVRFYGSLRGIDNEKLELGTSQDLKVFHNGTNSFISNTTGNLQIDSDAFVQVNATSFRVKNAADTELMATFTENSVVTLYNNNVVAFSTQTNGIASYGGEGNDAYIYLFADEGDDDADQWRLQALASDSKLEFRNRDDGNYRINAEMVGSGHVKLYNDNNQRFATFAGGSIVYGQWRQAETNGNTRTMKSIVTNGLASGETLSFQDTSLNFHGFGEVTVILRHNSTSQQATMKKFPISIRSTANAGLGSAIYTQNAATSGQSFTVAGTDRGVNVTNNESHGCTCTVILDLIIFA